MKAALGAPVLVRRAMLIAATARAELIAAAVDPLRHEDAARYFGLKLVQCRLDEGTDGRYVENKKTIMLTTRGSYPERRNFTFGHELTHALTRRDDDFLSDLHEIGRTNEEIDALTERCCDAGAAEYLLPESEIRRELKTNGLSTRLIPELGGKFGASSIATAFQIVTMADEPAYLLVLTSEKWAKLSKAQTSDNRATGFDARLVIAYSGRSLMTDNRVPRRQVLPIDHPLYAAHRAVYDPYVDRIPLAFVNGEVRELNCEAIAYKSKIFAIFTEI